MNDIVIPYINSGSKEIYKCVELIRKNLPHRNIFICGDNPEIDDTIYIERNKTGGTRYLDAERNIRLALEDERLSDEFYLFNDDFFILKPIKEVPLYHAGDIETVIKEKESTIKTHAYAVALKNTKRWLEKKGIDDIVAYTLHLPVKMNKQKRLEISDLIMPELEKGKQLLTKTIYFNIYPETSCIKKDVKVYGNEDPKDEVYLSTINDTQKAFIKL